MDQRVGVENGTTAMPGKGKRGRKSVKRETWSELCHKENLEVECFS